MFQCVPETVPLQPNLYAYDPIQLLRYILSYDRSSLLLDNYIYNKFHFYSVSPNVQLNPLNITLYLYVCTLYMYYAIMTRMI